MCGCVLFFPHLFIVLVLFFFILFFCFLQRPACPQLNDDTTNFSKGGFGRGRRGGRVGLHVYEEEQ